MENNLSPVIAVQTQQLSKSYGRVQCLKNINLTIFEGRVHCLLGDNGAGKSTLIKLLSGVTKPSSGLIKYYGKTASFEHPRQALSAGIATVFQDLAIIPMMSVVRNFFLGREITKGIGPLKRFDLQSARKIVRGQMAQMGIALRCPDQAAGTLSGGERQSLAIARAVYFGAKVLILDEPTSALGVTQTENVLRVINQAKERGIAVIFITHNVRHAYAVGDQFTILLQGSSLGTYEKSGLNEHQLYDLMAGSNPYSKDFTKHQSAG